MKDTENERRFNKAWAAVPWYTRWFGNRKDVARVLYAHGAVDCAREFEPLAARSEEINRKLQNTIERLQNIL